MDRIRIAILRETKTPPDKRVPLTPEQCRKLMKEFPGLEILVQPSDFRCFSDDEYRAEGIVLEEDLSSCQIVMGVKEVKTGALLDKKTYLFFSHTAKKQPYNRGLLQALVRKGIRLIDYEYLTTRKYVRVVAFGKWAGVVGTYNGLRAYGLKSGSPEMRPASVCHDLVDLRTELQKLDMGKTRIAITGGGRVAGGAIEILEAAGIKETSPSEYLNTKFDQAVFTRLDPWHYATRSDGSAFEFTHFVDHPEMYTNNFGRYAAMTNLFVACHFWDPRSPILLSRDDLAGGHIPISVIADISCDIRGPIASTIRASTIADPFYGYDPVSGKETEPFREGTITVMAVDNLPGELPRDASSDFGDALIEHVFPELLGLQNTGMLERASITSGGDLTKKYVYLQKYLEGTE